MSPWPGGGDGEFEITRLDGDIRVQGGVAWLAGRSTFKNRAGHEHPMRTTSVLVREDGQWRVVQSHTSLGVPNAEMLS